MAICLTIFGLAIAWISITLALDGQMYLAYLLALGAFAVDCTDGFIARKLNTDSSMGRYLDSLVDAVLYLIWPAIVCFSVLGLRDLQSILAQAMFLAAGVFRLARFNAIGFVYNTSSRPSYPGIPVVFSFVTVLVLFIVRLIWSTKMVREIAILLLVSHSVLMVSKIPFPKMNTTLVIGLILISTIVIGVYGKILF